MSTPVSAPIRATGTLLRVSWIATPILLALTILAVVLKLGGLISLAWVWVLAPAWIGAIFGLILFGVAIATVLRTIRTALREKQAEIDAEARLKARRNHPSNFAKARH